MSNRVLAIVLLICLARAQDCSCYDSEGACIDSETYGTLCNVDTINAWLLTGFSVVTTVALGLDHYLYK